MLEYLPTTTLSEYELKKGITVIELLIRSRMCDTRIKAKTFLRDGIVFIKTSDGDVKLHLNHIFYIVRGELYISEKKWEK